jgi:hypothetical protein
MEKVIYLHNYEKLDIVRRIRFPGQSAKKCNESGAKTVLSGGFHLLEEGPA